MKKATLTKAVGILALSLSLMACGSQPQVQPNPNPNPNPSSSFFTEGNAFGPSAPEGAENTTPEDFQAKIASGELVLTNPALLVEQKAATLKKYKEDRAFLEGLGTPSPDVQRLLSQDPNKDPLADGFLEVKNSDGTSQRVETLSDAAQMAQIVEDFKRMDSPENALTAYRNTFESSPRGVLDGLPNPDSLNGKSVAEIFAALLELDSRLGKVENLDGVKGEENPASLSSDGGKFTSQGAGNGVDSSGNCAHKAGGVFNNFWWPLKNFVTPVKNQGMRGTCWGFAAVAALESKALVVDGTTWNLSEQYLVHKQKLDWSPSNYGDGSSASTALTHMRDNNVILPSENVWTYNPAYGRPANAFDAGVSGTAASYTGACNSYSGWCSQTAHQSPVICTKVLFWTFCGYGHVNYVGNQGVKASPVNSLWSNQWGNLPANQRIGHFPLNTARVLLSQGYALMGSFGVYEGFDGPAANGFVTNYGTSNGRGGHVVMIAGYISNTQLSAKLPNAPQGAGGGYFMIKNSWGCGPADAGFYYIPVDYITKIFSGISYMDIGATRSSKWKQAAGLSTQGPKINISKPGSAQSGDLFSLPVYVNLKKTVTLEGSATDAQDGDISSKMVWTSNKQGNLGTGQTLNLNLSSLGTGDFITAKAKDNDGNESSATINIVDGHYPIVNVLFPAPSANLNTKTDYALEGKVEEFLGGNGNNGVFNCSTLQWNSSVAGEGPWIGCKPTINFTTAGTRVLTASYTIDGRSDSKAVTVNVQNQVVPPVTHIVKVSINSPKLPFSVGTYGSSALINLNGSVTVDGSSASCSTLKWYYTLETTSTTIIFLPKQFATGCAPQWDAKVGKYSISAEYDGGVGFQGSASGKVEVFQQFIR